MAPGYCWVCVSSQAETRDPTARAPGVFFWFHTWCPGPSALPSRCLCGRLEGAMCQWGRPWATALTLGNKAPPTQSPGFSFARQQTPLCKLFSSPTRPPPSPWQSYIFILPSEVTVHPRPAKYLHPIYFKMSRCNSETRFSFQKGNCEYKVMN